MAYLLKANFAAFAASTLLLCVFVAGTGILGTGSDSGASSGIQSATGSAPQSGTGFGAYVEIATAPAFQTEVRADQTADRPEWTPLELRRILSMSPVPALAPDPTNLFADDPVAARLGQHVFFDERFSSIRTVSCASCHHPDDWFTDGLPRAIAIAQTDRRTQSLVGAAHHRWFFWDGRADTLWSQALHPLEDPREHGFDRVSVVHLMAGDASLAAMYESVFGALPQEEVLDRLPKAARPAIRESQRGDARDVAWQSMDEEDQRLVNRIFVNIGKALAAYQRKLLPGESPFDRFAAVLRNGDDADVPGFGIDAQRGLRLFIGAAGCRTCHFGPLLSDGEFHTTGVPPLNGGRLHDAGRFSGIRSLKANPFRASGEFSDDPDAPISRMTSALRDDPQTWGRFRTPGLRNVAERPPFMHEGQFDTLREVLEHYSTLERAVLPAHHQERVLRPLHLSDREMSDLEAFLRALTGRPVPLELRLPPGGTAAGNLSDGD